MDISDIPQRLKIKGVSQAALARHLNLDPSSLTKTLKGERRLQPHEIPKIEEFLGERLQLDEADSKAVGPRRTATRKIAVYGHAAAGGTERIAFADDRVLEWREPPPFWNGVGDLVYVRVIGDSMEPRYFDGEVVPVRYGVRPGRNDDCLIEFNDDTVVIKAWVGEKDRAVHARQYNPPKAVQFPTATVRQIHAVWRPALI